MVLSCPFQRLVLWIGLRLLLQQDVLLYPRPIRLLVPPGLKQPIVIAITCRMTFWCVQLQILRRSASHSLAAIRSIPSMKPARIYERSERLKLCLPTICTIKHTHVLPFHPPFIPYHRRNTPRAMVYIVSAPARLPSFSLTLISRQPTIPRRSNDLSAAALIIASHRPWGL